MNGEKIPKKLIDDINQYRKKSSEEWENKLHISTKRILSSLFFFESGNSVYYNHNYLLSPIAYYYSIFHLSKSLLFLLPYMEIENHYKSSHNKVRNDINTYFIQRKILDYDYINLFDDLKNIREYVNYGTERWASLEEELKNIQPKILDQLEKGINLFKELCQDQLHVPRAIIGDGIGDDWCDSYLSKEEEKRVWDMAIKFNITN